MVVDSLRMSHVNWDVVLRIVHYTVSHPTIVMTECYILGLIISRSALIRKEVLFSTCWVLSSQIVMLKKITKVGQFHFCKKYIIFITY